MRAIFRGVYGLNGVCFQAVAMQEDSSTEPGLVRAELSEVGELKRRLSTERKKLRLVQDIARVIGSSLDLDSLLTLIMEKVCELMTADRATLFLVSEDRKELWSKVLQGGDLREIRLKVGEGIAGWVALSGEVVNISDAYMDTRFQPAVDLRSGYRTKSILCVAMRDMRGQISGVLQILNKEVGCFNEEDEELLAALSGQAAISVENAKLYHTAVARNVALLEAQDTLHARTRELNVLYDTERDMAEAVDLEPLLERLLERAMAVVDSEAGSVALVEKDSKGGKQLRFCAAHGEAEGEICQETMTLDTGIVGWATSNREPVIANDPESDARHLQFSAAAVQVSPRNLLCAPFVDGDAALGAIELRDKANGGDYDEHDLRMLTLIAGQASRAIVLQKSKQEVVEQNKLAGIGQMMAGVLHDLKTPMTIISGYAQLMAQMDDAEQREEYVEQILEQFDLLSAMTKEVLAFARGETTVLIRKVYMHRYLDQISEQLGYVFAGRNIDLQVQGDYRGVAHFDQQAILRLVHNLARNAADAMSEKPGVFRIIARVDEDSLCLDFIDTGPGIPVELEGRLFEAFSSTTKGGTGLGLAICKKIVEDHRGTIRCESSRDTGTTFFVRLPLRP